MYTNPLLWVIVTPFVLFFLYSVWKDKNWVYHSRFGRIELLIGRPATRVLLIVLVIIVLILITYAWLIGAPPA